MWADINQPHSRAVALIPSGATVTVTEERAREFRGHSEESIRILSEHPDEYVPARELGDYAFAVYVGPDRISTVRGWIISRDLDLPEGRVSTGQVRSQTRAAELTPLAYQTAPRAADLRTPLVDVRTTPPPGVELEKPYVPPPTTRTFARVRSPRGGLAPVIMHARLDPKIRASARIPVNAVVETFGEPRQGVVSSELQAFPKNHPEGWAGLYTRSIHVAPDGGVNDGWIRAELLRPLEKTELTPQGFPLDPSTYRKDL